MPGTWAQPGQSPDADPNKPACCTLLESEATPPAWVTPPGEAPRAAMIGSPFGPITPGTCWPRLTVPNPPTGSFFALSVLAHPPPKPAKSANVAAVRFIFPPSGRAQLRFPAIHSRQTEFRQFPTWNFGQRRNNRHSCRNRNAGTNMPTAIVELSADGKSSFRQSAKVLAPKDFPPLPRCYSVSDSGSLHLM